MRQLVTKSLAIEEIDQAFPLVQATLPQVGLDQWRRFAQSQIRTRKPRVSGIQSVLAEQKYIAGLSIYRIEQDLCHGPALIADHFMALDLFDRTAVIHALAEFLENLGRQRGCTAVHTQVRDRAGRWQGPPTSMIAILRERGHGIESMRLCKLIGEASSG